MRDEVKQLELQRGQDAVLAVMFHELLQMHEQTQRQLADQAADQAAQVQLLELERRKETREAALQIDALQAKIIQLQREMQRWPAPSRRSRPSRSRARRRPGWPI